eukprot:2653928-Prymnesium_polylepis.5
MSSKRNRVPTQCHHRGMVLLGEVLKVLLPHAHHFRYKATGAKRSTRQGETQAAPTGPLRPNEDMCCACSSAVQSSVWGLVPCLGGRARPSK